MHIKAAITRLILFSLISFPTLSFSNDFKLSNIIKLDPHFSKYVFVAEKTKLKLHIFQNGENGNLKKIISYPMAYGKVPGDKRLEGDKKTPEGIYLLKGFYKSNDLIKMYGDYGKIYGIGAFVTDYPNPIDKMAGKTGDGIWLHATNDESRIDKGLDSRGCVVIRNNHLKEVSQYINIKRMTPFIVANELTYHDSETFNIKSNELNEFITTWVEAWQTQELDDYMKHYHKKLFKNRNGGSYQTYKTHKRNVFKSTKFAEVKMDNVSIFTFNDYALIRMRQSYKSNLVDDVGFKELYLKQDTNYKWKIVREIWRRIDESDRELAFSAENQYFE